MLRIGPFRVVVYPNDHRPAHVHVIGNGWEAVFNLNCPDGVPELRENFGFSQPELTQLQQELKANQGKLCEEWRKIHGQP
ncbi:DUF4160 domain-containing protein [Telmatospirillum sp.]|uniref:DUF4160 domain-containing protein n=1 Tax=Telmatospirillum sp. TaxID=2079197 RepID=UPI002843236E|nr:DUF4160 domain-containing protein [Telmatospirillum sp.]MDR3440601.1 DUF4160 domain-containing protein [Telmatospirillum sp.]